MHCLSVIVEETYPTVGAMMSSIVIYLNANDAGPGFYQLAQGMHLLPRGASKEAREQFWVQQVRATFNRFRSGERIDLD